MQYFPALWQNPWKCSALDFVPLGLQHVLLIRLLAEHWNYVKELHNTYAPGHVLCLPRVNFCIYDLYYFFDDYEIIYFILLNIYMHILYIWTKSKKLYAYISLSGVFLTFDRILESASPLPSFPPRFYISCQLIYLLQASLSRRRRIRFRLKSAVSFSVHVLYYTYVIYIYLNRFSIQSRSKR